MFDIETVKRAIGTALITGNTVFTSGGKSLHVDVDGADNVVIVRTLRIGGQQAQTCPPQVKRGQVWQRRGKHYRVISVRDFVKCVICDVTGKPLAAPDGKAQIEDISTVNLRYIYTLVKGGVS